MRSRMAIALPVLIACLTLGTASAASLPAVHGPIIGKQPISQGTVASYNWSGYAIYKNSTTGGANITFSSATGTWTQPPVVGTCPKKSTLAAFYVGIDGYNSSTVEQIGTDADCVNGVPSYYAWYEMYPAAPIYPSTTTYPVTPGHSYTATVTWDSGSSFTLTLQDSTAGWTIDTTQAAPAGAARTSAEWIAESPVTGGHFWPLTDFGSVTFDSASAHSDSLHTSGSIGSASWSNDAITMVARRPITRAQPGALDAEGDGFLDTWLHS